MIKLYGHLMSRAHRVAWMLKELNLPYEHEPVHFLDGSTRLPEFLAINPNGRVPALVDDGLSLFESLAINLHLARKYGGAVAPVGLEGESLATQWSMWVITEVEKPLLFAAANLFLFPEKDRSEDEAEMALNRLVRPFNVLEAHLGTRPYLLGEAFTVADLNVASVMTLAPLAKIDLSQWPKLNAWLGSCLERPAAADWKPIHFTIPRPQSALGVLQMFL